MFTSRNKFYFAVLFLISIQVAINSEAGMDIVSIIKRCEEDVLISQQEVFGRNAWGRKCHYMSEEEEAYSNERQLYLTFTQGSLWGYPNIPVNESLACIDGL